MHGATVCRDSSLGTKQPTVRWTPCRSLEGASCRAEHVADRRRWVSGRIASLPQNAAGLRVPILLLGTAIVCGCRHASCPSSYEHWNRLASSVFVARCHLEDAVGHHEAFEGTVLRSVHEGPGTPHGERLARGETLVLFTHEALSAWREVEGIYVVLAADRQRRIISTLRLTPDDMHIIGRIDPTSVYWVTAVRGTSSLDVSNISCRPDCVELAGVGDPGDGKRGALERFIRRAVMGKPVLCRPVDVDARSSDSSPQLCYVYYGDGDSVVGTAATYDSLTMLNEAILGAGLAPFKDYPAAPYGRKVRERLERYR